MSERGAILGYKNSIAMQVHSEADDRISVIIIKGLEAPNLLSSQVMIITCTHLSRFFSINHQSTNPNTKLIFDSLFVSDQTIFR